MKLFQSFIGRRDRARIEKLGSGIGNYLSLVVRFGYALTFLLGGRRHARFFLAVAHFGRWLIRWRGGRFGLVRYLKSCQITLMQLLSAGPLSDSRELGGIHGRAGGNIPSVIPVYHRVSIRRGDISVIRFWLSLLGIYRIIDVRGKASFESIYQPGVESQFKLVYELGTFLNHIQNTSTLGKTLLKRRDLGTEFKFRPRALLTSGANVPGGVGAFWAMAWDAYLIWANRLNKVGQAYMDWCLCTAQVHVVELLKNAARLAGRASNVYKNVEIRSSKGWRGNPRLSWIASLKSFSTLFARKRENEGGFTWKLAPFADFRDWLVLGRLHQIPEPAGKVRVVAMGTWWIQVLLYPLHRILYSLLRSIPQDGTYNQVGPLAPLLDEIKLRLTRGECRVFSYDLKSATDRFPIWFQVEILTRLTSRRFAEAWADLMVSYPFYTGSIQAVPRGQPMWYRAGQPMGLYSSWAMFSLSHHFLVQLAAHRVGYTGWFPWYALLGDDIVILGEDVARAYAELCSALGITIGLAKSLQSTNGSFEFAKRFYYKGVDCSPTSVREFWQALKSLPAFSELITRVKLQNPDLRLCDAVRAAKYGYHSVEKFTRRTVSLGNTRLANLLVTLTLPGGPFEQPLASLFSSTGTVVRPDENLVDTPITERRVKSVSRTIGDSLVKVSARVAEYLNAPHRYEEYLKDLDPEGILRYVVETRASAVSASKGTITSLQRIGRYLQAGKLNSRGLITLLGKIIPIWKVSTTDVASFPDPFALDAVGGTLSRPQLVKLLKVRVKVLGLAWKGRPVARVKPGGKK
nr:MAG: putative RNA-dependent RNA polymerase [Mitoviridae sp.]